MSKLYISFDIEASGPTPGRYSMLALGAAVVGRPHLTFYRELWPITDSFDFEAMRVCAIGLRCLDELRFIPEYNPSSDLFDPSRVLEVLYDKGTCPERVMEEYASWIRTVSGGHVPIDAATPIKFDGMFTAWYFDNFYYMENPFGHSGMDMASFYKGFMKDPGASMKALGIREKLGNTHNALDDAIQQAIEFEMALELIKKK